MRHNALHLSQPFSPQGTGPSNMFSPLMSPKPTAIQPKNGRKIQDFA
jgi:hypothetical protein